MKDIITESEITNTVEVVGFAGLAEEVNKRAITAASYAIADALNDEKVKYKKQRLEGVFGLLEIVLYGIGIAVLVASVVGGIWYNTQMWQIKCSKGDTVGCFAAVLELKQDGDQCGWGQDSDKQQYRNAERVLRLAYHNATNKLLPDETPNGK